MKENKNNIVPLINSQNDTNPPTTAKSYVKLPKLSIQKFLGDPTEFTNFWNTFKVCIDENESLNKVEKFNYLRCYLGSSALYSIEGLEISEENYDEAIKILKSRFGKKEVIVNYHMNKLLNLNPVYKSNDISRLKKLTNEIEINTRALNSLGVEPETYSTMLTAVIMKVIPQDLALEFNRQNIKNSKSSDFKDILNFLQTEIESRERSFTSVNKVPVENRERSFTSINKVPVENNYKQKYQNQKYPKNGISSTHEFVTLTNKKEQKQSKCIFCKNNNHDSEHCTNFDVEKKRSILKSQGRCFLCLQPRHRIKDCEKKEFCSFCGTGGHNVTLCFKKQNNTSHKMEESKNIQGEVTTAVSCIEKRKILLQTCRTKVKNGNREKNIRILLDTGSQRTFLHSSVSSKLNLNVIRKEKLSVYTFGREEPMQKTYEIVNLKLQKIDDPNSTVNIEAIVTDKISGSNLPPPEVTELKEMSELKHLTLADPPNCDLPITLLIGADHYYDIVTGKIKHVNKNLVAVETIFGWSLHGKNSENQCSLNLNIIVDERTICEQIKMFWDLEASGLINTKQDDEPTETEVMKTFEKNIKYENNRYKVSLPWKENKRNLDENRKNAENRLVRLNKRFNRNPELFSKYKEVLNDYLRQDIIELVPDSESTNQGFYLPHREVIREDRATSKLRIVFDASSHGLNSPSLNDTLYPGPNLYPEVFNILLRFRLYPIAFTTDVKQAFLQILIEEEDKNFCKFLFTDNPFNECDPPNMYRFTRIIFGLNCSPFLLAATIKHHLRKYRENYPETVKFLEENIYVDDIIGSKCSVEQALSTTIESLDIFKNASMLLHKWHTNSEHLQRLWEVNGVMTNDNSETSNSQFTPFKVLGMAWDSKKDLLYFDIRELLLFVSKKINTKRFVLQVLGRIFDPLGFLGPFTLRIKCLMQKIWSLGMDWDDDLPGDLVTFWKSWCDEIPQLAKILVPRQYFCEIPNFEVNNLQLHIFSDASTIAFGTVAYLRLETPDRNIRTVFIASKNRVAPLKSLTLPRLELTAALCSAKLSCNILKALKLSIPCFFWTDSKIAYFWIRGVPEKFKPFVKNRVEEIQKLTSPSNWHHCPGTENPADLVSRGTKVSKLIDDPLWSLGPKWLNLPSEFWPTGSVEKLNESELEYKKKSNNVSQNACIVEELKMPINIEKFSNFEKLIRVTAWVMRFVMKIKKSTVSYETLTTEELFQAENYLIRNEQKKFYKNEIESLSNSKQIGKNSPLHNFVPFIDEAKILRLGGRLEFGDLSVEEKHPIIIPRHSWLSVLIVRHNHEKIMHAGVAHTLSKIRTHYWIPKGRQLVKSVIKNCLICKKYLSKPADQISAPLPSDRINESPPFSICGTDFAGPIYVKNSAGVKKSYIVIFTCAVTRALHLELSSDMTTDSFMLAFRRFLARRGNCKVIYSDNAKSFKKAKEEIENLYNIISSKSFLEFIAKERIKWKNIIERAAWWGGFYERLVRSVKECLRKIMGKALLSFEETQTLLTEVEYVLNTRPLTYVYQENNEPQPLTPLHFLNFGKELSLPINFFDVIENSSKRSSFLRRKRYQSLLMKQTWSKWKQQYLLDLKTAHSLKNPSLHTPLKVGDIVLVEEDSKNKFLWKLGKIHKEIIGRDKNIRSYEVKTANGLLRRTVQHLYPLEIQ